MRAIENKISGFTLIEMLVGIVIGMIVVAAASVMMVSVLKSQKDVTASARLNQELGAAMAVMSNEIRRAGFSVCDGCQSIDYNSSGTNKDLEILDVDGSDPVDDGDCILLRYNADLDAVTAELDKEELRGFRLQGNKIQIAVPSGADDVTCGGAGGYWKDLTDPRVMMVSKIPGVKFFTSEGSKCRSIEDDEEKYWVVDPGVTGMPCDIGTTTVTCTNLVGNTSCGGDTTVKAVWVIDPVTADPKKVIGVRQVRISLRAVSAFDSSVTKDLRTSIKVANPRVVIP